MGTFAITWKHVRRSPYQAFAAIMTLFLTLLLSGIFFLTTLTSVFILQYFEGKPQITVFFKDTAAKTEIDTLTKTLEDTGKTDAITFVSKDEALAIYKEQNKNDPLLLEMVTADILPASLEITAKDPKYLGELEPLLKSTASVEEVVYQKDVVEGLIMWTNAIRLVFGVLAGLLAADAILIIITVTSMKIAMRREEVEILRLVGASPWYIRWPFIWEGGFYGICGANMAWAVIMGLTLWQREQLLAFLGIIPDINTFLTSPTSSVFLLYSAGFLGLLGMIGFILGSFGSYIAVNRYLKI